MKTKARFLNRAEIRAMTPATFKRAGFPSSIKEMISQMPRKNQTTIVRHAIQVIRQAEKAIRHLGLDGHPLWFKR